MTDVSQVSENKIIFSDYILQPITAIPSISVKTQTNLMRLSGQTYRHLLFHLPSKIINRDIVETVDLEQHHNQIITFKAYIGRHIMPRSSKAPYKVIVHTMAAQGSLDIEIVFFHTTKDYIKTLLPPNQDRIISGKLEVSDTKIQIIHPDYSVAIDKQGDLPTIQPIYPLTAGLTQRLLAKALSQILPNIPNTPEWIRPDLMKKYNWVSFKESLLAIHNPKHENDCSVISPYRQRLAYDAILAHQLTLAIRRAKRQKKPAICIGNSRELADKIIKNLPFSLTNDQQIVVNEIYQDLQNPFQMTRLVQGDVGSGKTIVALLAATMVIQNSLQVALMVPTEILAKQHYDSLKPLCNAVGINIGILTGKDKISEARQTLERLENGRIDLLIGTHALIQERVIFKNLGLAIIDEQHRFGVVQREELVNKGSPNAHLLLMTATPIPRSLAMAHYGDCDLSVIAQKPPLRKPVITRVMPISKIDDIIGSLQRVIHSSGRAYWVCPLVEESEKMDLMAAEERFALLSQTYPTQVGLVHGKMKSAEKEAVITDFTTGKISILVSTTVIEVGVNVPEATVMIIEQAERFGLSQLHQLRGRVGRGTAQASCILIYKMLNTISKQRLSVVRETEDGFVLAEKDLYLRGAGDLLGTKQTGLLSLPAFDFFAHEFLIKIAKDDAQYILQKDPDFISDRGKNLQTLMKIFGY